MTLRPPRGSECPGFMMTLAMLACSAAPLAAELYQPNLVHDVDLLDNGNIFVTDGGSIGDSTSSGIYEIDRDGNILWSYTSGLNFAHNADKQPDGSVIISDTSNDRVIIIDPGGTILWNSDDVTLSDGSSLDYPNDANLLPNGNRLITDRNNQRVIEIDAGGTIVWQFGLTGIPGGGPNRLRTPHNADRLANGNTLIADSDNNRVIEVNPAGTIVWSYAGGLNLPRDADRLANGNTLINDTGTKRIIEVTPGGTVVWTYTVTVVSYDSDRLDNGNTLISVRGSILEVDTAGAITWSYPVVLQTEVVEGYLVTAPNGNNLWVKIIQPRVDLYPGQSFPAVIQVPGGLGAGESGDTNMADSGFVEFHFNAEGRGILHPSEGVEDYNGFVHQADLKAVIEFAHARSNVQTDNIGVVTGSYGITMGAGCLGRYPWLPVKYLVDQEGPSESYVTCFEPWALDDDPTNDRHETAYLNFGHYSTCRDPSPANVDWWVEREATRYIGNMRCRYVRLQAQWDHAQPPNAQWPNVGGYWEFWPCADPCVCWYPCKFAVDMINLATLGRSPWTRVNAGALGNPPNTTFDHDNPPAYYSGTMGDHPGELQLILREMADMPPLPPLGDVNGDGQVDLDDLDLFVAILLDPDIYPGLVELADMNVDDQADGNDIQRFVEVLLGG